MKPVLLACSALVVLAFPFAAMADNSKIAAASTNTTAKAGANTEAVSAVEDSVGAAIGTVSAEMTTTTKGFVEAASIGDMYEVQAGKLALQRSKNAKIKAFAQEMVTAHAATGAKLKGILQANNIKITPPAKLDERRQSLIENLTGAKAEDFDVRYLNQQVNAHQEALILLSGYAKDGDNAALKKFAAETRPAVEKHLNRAKQLDKADEDQKSAARE